MSMSSRVRLVVVMDPIEAIKPAKDSTLAILLAAQARGWQLFYAEQKHLWLRDGIAWGRLAPLQVFDDPGTWFVRGETRDARLGEFDDSDAQGSAFRYGVHLHHVHSGSCRDPRRVGVQPAAGSA